MAEDFEILKRIYNSFDPFRPLPPGDPAYVDCRDVRGDNDVLVELGREILLSNRMKCQLYVGHRGAGKSTELLRLQEYLDQQGCFVVYFPADEEDIDPEDAQYTDILLACTRRLLEALKSQANPGPLLNWLQSRWQELRDLALTEVSLESLDVEAQISQFTKLTANLRAVPTLRQKIRERVNPHTITLIQALNQFINEAKQHLPPGYQQLVVIADNLDRIVPVVQEDGRTNHDHIFIDRSEQLKALNCHVIYTVPVSMVFSSRMADLREIYGDAQVLPMVMVRNRDNTINQVGLSRIEEMIAKRVYQHSDVSPALALDRDIFDQRETLERLCLMSGGHVRNLLLLVQEAVTRTDRLPIPVRAVQRAITEARNTYRNTVDDDQWMPLAKVAKSKRILNDELHRRLLFNRCILEYRFLNDEGEIQCWYDVHPLLQGAEDFKSALTSITEL
jgi:hypothetical protein